MTRVILDGFSDAVETEGGALVTVAHDHSYTHKGLIFNVEHSAVVVNTASLDIHFVTAAAKSAYCVITVSSTGAATAYLYEAVTTSANGTALTPRNFNRNYADTTGVLVYHTPTVSGTGTTILTRLIGGGSNPSNSTGGEGRHDTEWVLKPNTKYLIRLTNTSGGNATELVNIQYYEE